MLKFLEALYCDVDAYIYSWSVSSKQSDWYHTTELDRMAAECSGEIDLYFGVGYLNKAGKPTTRAKNTDISGIPGYWIDIDIADAAAHKSADLPPDWESALKLLSPEPTAIVSSGYGLHAYWLFNQPWDFANDGDRQKAAQGLQALQAKVRESAAVHGWTVDPTHDLTRILRLPGTGNGKKQKAVPVKIVKLDGPRYSRDRFSAADQPIQSTSVRADNFKRNPDDGPADLVIDNCKFIQYCRDNSKILPEPLWQAMLSNVARCQNGPESCHNLSKAYDGYSQEETDKKIAHVLNEMHPTTCAYIQQTLGFKGCPTGGCVDIKSPCVWSLAKLPRARAIAKTVTKDNVFEEISIGALAILKQADPGEYAIHKERLQKDKVPIRQLNQAINNKRNPAIKVVESGDRPTVLQSLPDAPIDLIVPPDWRISATGLIHQEYRGEALKTTRASHMPILLTGRTYNVTTETEKLTISYKRGFKWHNLTLPRSQVFNARKLPDAADMGLPVSSETARYLVRWFDDLDGINDLPVTKSVARMGWHGTDTFFPGAENDYVLDMDDGGEVQGAFQIRGEFEKWKETASGVRKFPLARLFLACSFASPLLRILEQRTFMTYIWGNSSGGKTAALIFAMSVWGAPERLMTNFSSTRNAIERWAGYMPDLPLALNERQVAGSGREKQEWLESIVYLLGEEKGRMRASRTGLQRTASWRTIALGTGEQPISTESSAQGVKTRVLEIAGEPFNDNEFAASLHSISRKHCGHAGGAFVQRLIEHDPEDIRQAAESLRNLLRDDYPNHFHVHIDSVVSICIADKYSSEWIFGLDPEQADNEAYELAQEIIKELPTQREISDVERGWEFLTNWLAMNEPRFDTGLADAKMSPALGFFKDERTYIYPEALRKAMTEAGFSYDKLLREFAKLNKIETEGSAEKARFTVKVYHPRYPKTRPRMVALVMGAVGL